MAYSHESSMTGIAGSWQRIHAEASHAQPPAKSICVLLIEADDDEIGNVADALADSSITTVKLETASTATHGINRLRHGGVDAVILGLDNYQDVHACFPAIPLIILTEFADEAAAVQSLRDGAQDLLFKHELDGRLLDRMLRYGIERQRRRELEKQMRATELELSLAAGIQRRLFPINRPNIPGFDFAGAFHSAYATCGDWFDFVSLDDGRFGIVIGDVSGKGMGPAMVATETRAIVRSLLMHTSDLREILSSCNRMLVNDLSEFRFVTLFFALFDPQARTMTYVGAGHRGFIVNAVGECRVLDSTCMPLGLDDDLRIPELEQIHLSPGDVFVALTDGVEEATSADGDAFGFERVVEIVRSRRHESAQLIADRLIHGVVREFASHAPQDDDFTAVLLRIETTDNREEVAWRDDGSGAR